jgi:hypothetical protein
LQHTIFILSVIGMIVKRTAYLFLGVLLLIGVAAAIDISGSNISSGNTGWLVANGFDSATITVYAQTAAQTPVSGAIVTFSLDPLSTANGGFNGGLFTTSVTTGTDGKATVLYNSGIRSGNAIINATITYPSSPTTPLTVSVTQKINHDTPGYANISYPAVGTVGTDVPITIQLFDSTNNPVDNKNPADIHPIILDTTISGGRGFYNSSSGLYVDHIVLQPDASGYATVNFRLSTAAGKNIFILEPVGYIWSQSDYVTGVGNGTAAYLSQSYPVPNYLPADGAPTHYFTIDYTLTDEFGNPAYTSLLFSADDGTSALKTSNPTTGVVRAYFGPKTQMNIYTLTATTPSNASVLCLDGYVRGGCNQTVQFDNTSPTDMSVSANPEGMASIDASPTSFSIIQARVMDIRGNPVPGEEVIFTLGNATYPGGPYNVTSPPSLNATSAKVTNGYATIQFTPGGFAGYGTSDYNATATGQVVVTAKWGTVTRNVTLSWKNYPYLSVGSAAACTGAEVGKAFNVTIVVSGDGAALKPKPIDAMMVMDNSGSMTMNPQMSGPDGTRYKYYYSQVAGRTFVGKMNPVTDKVGLVKYGASATLGYNVSGNFAGVINAINQSATGGNTNTRDALKLGIDNVIIDSKNPKAVKAVILLTDGAYNTNGDPLARTPLLNCTSSCSYSDGDKKWKVFGDYAVTAPEQNVAYLASSHGIRIYTITLGTDDKIQSGYPACPAGSPNCYNTATQFQIYDTMDQIASQTGGQHFHATDGTQLINYYETIAGLLQETAGGETQVNLNFGKVNINNNPNDMNITKYLNYTYYHDVNLTGYQPTDSTYINRSKLNLDGTRTVQSESVQDDINHWLDHNMTFDVGTIKLNESWSTNFRLKLNMSGSITLFGPDQPSSKITFKDAITNTTQEAFIPSIQCNIIDKQPGNKVDANLTVDSLGDYLGTTFTTTWPIQWKTTYNGSAAMGWENVQYLNWNKQSQGWKEVPTGMVFIAPDSFEKSDSVMIDTSDDIKFPPGDKFCVRVVPHSPDVNGDHTSAEFCNTKTGSGAGQFIKLE